MYSIDGWYGGLGTETAEMMLFWVTDCTGFMPCTGLIDLRIILSFHISLALKFVSYSAWLLVTGESVVKIPQRNKL